MTPISKAPPTKNPVSKTAASLADLRGTNLYRVAIVGAASLKGKEIAEILRDRNFPPSIFACWMAMSLSGNWKRWARR
jgi:hypothetical protein